MGERRITAAQPRGAHERVPLVTTGLLLSARSLAAPPGLELPSVAQILEAIGASRSRALGGADCQLLSRNRRLDNMRPKMTTYGQANSWILDTRGAGG